MIENPDNITIPAAEIKRLIYLLGISGQNTKGQVAAELRRLLESREAPPDDER